VLKVAKHIFEWTADAKMADFYERSFLNGTGRVLRRKFTLEDAIGSLAFLSGVHSSYRSHFKFVTPLKGF
jgi:hypothetical protein